MKSPKSARIAPALARFSRAGDEPGLAEMLRDPIVGLVMRRDNVSVHDVAFLIKRTGRRFAQRDLGRRGEASSLS